MASLHHKVTQTPSRLISQHLIGRAERCHLRIPVAHVSSEHASIRWTGEGWELRDLGSRNGTFVDGHRIEPGQRVRLACGQQLSFGRPDDPWVVTDVDAPAAAASSDHTWIFSEDGLLMLPDTTRVEACVYADEQGGWRVEIGSEYRPVADGEVLVVGGRAWLLSLPTVVAPTSAVPTAEIVTGLRMRFRVSSDEEHVELDVEGPGLSRSLPHRAHSFAFLTLARARMDADPSLPEAERGWVYADELARRLRLDIGHFNVAIFRARQQLRDAGVPNADALFERRRGSGQIRLGVADISVVRT